MKFIYTCLFILLFLDNRSFGQVEVGKSFLDSLAENTDATIPQANEDDIFWHSIPEFVNANEYIFSKKLLKYGDKAYGESPIFFPKPNTHLLLNKKLLVNDVEVVQQKHNSANGRIAFASCYKGKPTIFFSSLPDPRLCDETLAFFREHEYAHLKLGHSKCFGESVTPSTNRLELEKAADLEAARTILSIPDGHLILRYVIGALFAMDIKAKSSHPSSKDRAIYIIKEFSP